ARLDPSAIDAWVASARTAGVGGNQLHKSYAVLESVCAMAVERKLIPSSPVPQLDRPRRPEAAERRFLSVEEVDALAEAIAPRFRALVLTLAWTGLRFGEACALRREDVDLLRRQLVVERTVNEIRGTIQLNPPKTAQAR